MIFLFINNKKKQFKQNVLKFGFVKDIACTKFEKMKFLDFIM